MRDSYRHSSLTAADSVSKGRRFLAAGTGDRIPEYYADGGFYRDGALREEQR